VHGGCSGNERVIGQIAGFRVAMKVAEIREFGKKLVIVGGIKYEAGRAETQVGFVKVLENALNRMEQVLEEECEYLARTEKRMADILAEIAKPFDKVERLELLKQRQREIEAELDLSKGENTAIDEIECTA